MHCKAGRGRSTTLVLCYLVAQMHMSPADAYAFVRAKRPQVCLAEGQWAAVHEVSCGGPVALPEIPTVSLPTSSSYLTTCVE